MDCEDVCKERENKTRRKNEGKVCVYIRPRGDESAGGRKREDEVNGTEAPNRKRAWPKEEKKHGLHKLR